MEKTATIVIIIKSKGIQIQAVTAKKVASALAASTAKPNFLALPVHF